VEDVYTLLGFLLFPTTWHSEDIRGFQCLRVSSGLFWRWSPYTVQGGAGETGLVAELLKKSPDDFQADLLFAFVQSFSLLLWSGVLALTRPSVPTGNSGKSWRDPFVSQSATGAFVCHAHVSLTRGFEMKK